MTQPEHDPAAPAGAAPVMTREEAKGVTMLGMDWGRRRIGLAIKPAGQEWALPQGTLTVNNEGEALRGVRAAIARAAASVVVVGLPFNPDPAQARQIKQFCRKAREGLSGVRWRFVDERLTSQAAEASQHGLAGASARHKPCDDLAAALILETFIQSCP